MLEQQSQDPCGDRADHEQPAELRVCVVRADPAVAEATGEAFHDSHPISPEEREEDDRRREVGGDEEADEVRVVLVDVPPEELRDDHAVAEARDREELGHALEQSEEDGLPVGDERGEDQAASSLAGCLLPVWNQAKIRSASPTRNAAIPCFTWWCPDPAACPGIHEGREPAGSAQ